jgi:hypothetical protein
MGDPKILKKGVADHKPGDVVEVSSGEGKPWFRGRIVKDLPDKYVVAFEKPPLASVWLGAPRRPIFDKPVSSVEIGKNLFDLGLNAMHIRKVAK